MEDVKQKNGFVAVIDVLGFRELVGRDDRLASVREYVGTITSVLAASTGPKALQFVLFSDSLVINTIDNQSDSFELLVRACSNLLYDLAQLGVSVRGAISHGEFVRGPTTNQGVIVAGPPIVEAEFYQRQQDWVGIILAPSVIRANPDVKNQLALRGKAGSDTFEAFLRRSMLGLHLQHWPQIPFHRTSPLSNHEYDGFVIVPLPRELNSWQDVEKALTAYTTALQRMKEYAPDPVSQQKYANTLLWLGGLRASWSNRTYG